MTPMTAPAPPPSPADGGPVLAAPAAGDAPPPLVAADRAPQPAGLGWLDAALGAERLRGVRMFADQPDDLHAGLPRQAVPRRTERLVLGALA